MQRRWLELVLVGLLLGLTGCGGDPPAPKPLTAEEEKQFEAERQKDRKSERRVKEDG
jgi:hypothetical protein